MGGGGGFGFVWVGVGVWALCLCFVVCSFSVLFSSTITLMGKRELIASLQKYSCCHMAAGVMCHFLAMP